MTASKNRSSRLLIRVAVAATLALFTTSGDAQAGSGHGHGHGDGDRSSHVSAIVVSPTGLTTSDPDLAITQPETGGVLGAVEVRLTADNTGADHWVHLPLSLPAASHSGKGRAHELFVVAVEVCHQEEDGNPGSAEVPFIAQLLLTELVDVGPGTPVHTHDDIPFSATPTCVRSDVPVPFVVGGSVTLSMNLSFATPSPSSDVFRFGTFRVLLTPKPSRYDPSDPSDPSGPSHPSEPSHPSGPSDDRGHGGHD